MDNSVIATFILKILLAILLITTYFYIEKLEQTGCECSEHPNRQFIKSFSLFGFVFYLITVFVNPANLDLGNAFNAIYTLVDFLFFIMLLVFFYYTIDYIRYLINEKCKCSEDMRRELILGGSIIELILIVIVFIGSMLIPVTGSCVTSIIDNAAKTSSEIKKTVSNPYKSIVESPKNITNTSKNFKKVSQKIFNNVDKKIFKSKR
tara:strand:- start:301 stop:918 length:618 start_codon:yes stop_codon:yes gene_type:complete